MPWALNMQASAMDFVTDASVGFLIDETETATARRVAAKLVPVSPSGTGNTLIRFNSSRPASTQSAAASSARCRRAPSRYRIPTTVPSIPW